MRRLTGLHVLLMFLAFFGVTFAVNAYMVARAIGTFSGEVVPNSYLHGLNYNDTLAARARQRAEGWSAALAAAPLAKGVAELALTIRDKEGRPVRGLVLQGTLRLPASESEDKHFQLAETAPGRYEGRARGVRAALWELDVQTPTAKPAEEDAPRFETRNRLWLR